MNRIQLFGRPLIRGSMSASKRTFIAIVAGLVGVVGAVVSVATATATAAASPACVVDYKVLNQWSDGFVASVEITNTDQAIDGWTLGFDMPDGQLVVNGWAGEFSQNGASVDVEARPWNRSIASGASVTAGFVGRFDSTNGVPTSFSLNGEACDSNPQPTTVAPDPVAPDPVAPDPVAPDPVAPDPVAPDPAGQLYVDPGSSAAVWVSNNRSDFRADAIESGIASQSIARWFGDWSSNVESDVRSFVTQAHTADAVPVLVAYNIPDRDCGQHSSGGAPSFAAYSQWIADFAEGLGNGPAYIVLEPDALALNSCGGSDRNTAISQAGSTIKRECGACMVYLDAGHSNWVTASDMASRLTDAGVMSIDGFATNVSNYNATNVEHTYGQAILQALGNPSGMGQIIDTSRNGGVRDVESAWCDPSGAAIGASPTSNSGLSGVDAHLWIKVPGEADGCAAAAGAFVPDIAYGLVTD